MDADMVRSSGSPARPSWAKHAESRFGGAALNPPCTTAMAHGGRLILSRSCAIAAAKKRGSALRNARLVSGAGRDARSEASESKPQLTIPQT